MDTSPPPTEAELFERDDMEFRTITTLLNILSSRERITVENFYVSRGQRPHLKLLAALASVLVRDHEILTIISKRSGRGPTVYIGLEVEEVEPDIQDDCITHGGPVHPVELLITPNVEVDPDIFNVIVSNWYVTRNPRVAHVNQHTAGPGTWLSNFMFRHLRPSSTNRSTPQGTSMLAALLTNTPFSSLCPESPADSTTALVFLAFPPLNLASTSPLFHLERIWERSI